MNQTATSRETQRKTIGIATLAALAAIVLMIAAARLGAFDSFATLAPIAFACLAFLAGARAAFSPPCLSKRPVLRAVTLASVTPLLPDLQPVALVGAFAISGLLLGGCIGPVVAAFSRERLAAISGSIGLGGIGYVAIRAGLVTGPTMQAVLAGCAVVATLAMASAVTSAVTSRAAPLPD